MAIDHILARGIGFDPGTVRWIPTHGFYTGVAPASNPVILRTSLAIHRSASSTPAVVVRSIADIRAPRH